MGLLNPNYALEESWLLFFLTGILGLRVIRARYLRWIFSLYPLLLIATHSALFFVTKEPMWRHYDSFLEVIRYFKDQKVRNYVSLLTVPVLLLSSLKKSSEDTKTCKVLDEVDKLLVYLNVHVDNRLIMRIEAANLVLYIGLNIFVNLWTYFSLVTADCGLIFDAAWIYSQFSILLGVVTTSAFVTLINKIRYRFEMVNQAISKALLKPEKTSIIIVRSESLDKASRLRLARRAHLKLLEAASAVNKAYEFRLLFIFLLNFLAVITNLLEAIPLIDDKYGAVDFLIYAMWIAFHLGEFFYFTNACRAAVTEAQLAATFFLRTSLAQGPNGLSEEIKIFSQQLTNDKLEFKLISFSLIDFPKGLTILIVIIIYLSLLPRTYLP